MFMFNPQTYELLKKLVQVILPAIGSAYFALANIWGLPAAENVVGTIAVITTFLGICLGISSSTYNKLDAAFDGAIVVTRKENGAKLFSLEINGDPEDIEKFGSLKFRVVQGAAEASEE